MFGYVCFGAFHVLISVQSDFCSIDIFFQFVSIPRSNGGYIRMEATNNKNVTKVKHEKNC